MIVEKQLKNDKYNIFNFVKYVSELEQNENMVIFLKQEQEYKINEINDIFKKCIEYHSMFENYKFDIWLLSNKEKLKNSITFVEIDKLDKTAKKHLNKLRKYSEQIIVEFSKETKIEDIKKYAKTINENIIIGYANYDTTQLRKIFMLLGKKFEYKKVNNQLKVLAIMHVFNEEDIIETTLEHLIAQDVDIYLLDNWSTDETYKIAEKMQKKYPNRIKLEKFPEEKPKENNYEWAMQLQKTEELSKKLDYDWYIHHDADEIRITPYLKGVTLKDMISYVDSLGYNAINTTVLDFRMTNKNDDIFNKDAYFEIGRKPSRFMQIKTWKKSKDIDLTSSGGHLAKFENQKIYPIKIINKHYPLRNIKQAEKKVYKDRLPRFAKEKKLRGWHSQYDKMSENNDFIYEKQNLHLYKKDILEKFALEIISGIGIDRI